MAKMSEQKIAILLHGIFRTASSMKPIEKALKRKGYLVINIDYPARKKDIETLSEEIYQQIKAFCNQENIQLDFVVHSMGGLIIRDIIKNHAINNIRHIIMLGTPNAGSEVADFLKNFFLYRYLYGPAGQQLATNHPFPEPQFGNNTKVGIIAGKRCLDPICYFLLPKPHDGKVSVASTKLKGMHDHIVLPVDHSFMMYRKSVLEQIIYFLEEDRFNHPK